MLRDKTRILITNDFDILDQVDRVIVMEQGCIKYQGHFDELKHLDYFRTIQENVNQLENEKEDNDERKGNHVYQLSQKISSKENEKEDDSNKSNSIAYFKGSTINNDENKEKIKVNWRSYIKFFFFSKWTLIFIILILGLAYYKAQIKVKFNLYLIRWIKEVNKNHENDKEKLKKICTYMVYIIIASFIASLMKTVFIFTISIQLFRRMLKRLLHAPMNLYFDVTPSGMILNRFTKDLSVAELQLPASILAQIEGIINIIVDITVIAKTFIWILIILPVVMLSLIV